MQAVPEREREDLFHKGRKEKDEDETRGRDLDAWLEELVQGLPDQQQQLKQFLPPPGEMMAPPFFEPQQAAPLPAAAAAAAGGAAAAPKSAWTEHTAPDGRKYYFNAQTKQSTYEKPQELLQPEVSGIQTGGGRGGAGRGVGYRREGRGGYY